MLSWIWNKLPQEWKLGVAIKKASYTVGKLTGAVLSYGAIKTFVGDHLTPDQVKMVQDTTALVTAAGLEGLHDWARLKYPNVKWL